jgi:DNA-binding cell septation regulator SpoVG
MSALSSGLHRKRELRHGDAPKKGVFVRLPLARTHLSAEKKCVLWPICQESRSMQTPLALPLRRCE